jgi:hypothetical protein
MKRISATIRAGIGSAAPRRRLLRHIDPSVVDRSEEPPHFETVMAIAVKAGTGESEGRVFESTSERG